MWRTSAYIFFGLQTFFDGCQSECMQLFPGVIAFAEVQYLRSCLYMVILISQVTHVCDIYQLVWLHKIGQLGRLLWLQLHALNTFHQHHASMTGDRLFSPKKFVFSYLLNFFLMSLMDYIHNGSSSPPPTRRELDEDGSNPSSLGQLVAAWPA